MSNKNIFHVKMPVFDAQYGWGKVVAIFDNLCLPVEVKFNKLRDTIYYTYDGRISESAIKSLSKTEYTLQGFTQ